jgi:transposase
LQFHSVQTSEAPKQISSLGVVQGRLDSGVTAEDSRLFLEAVLWRVRTFLPWHDLPKGFGKWNSVFQRFRRWVRAEVFDRIFERVSDEPDFEYALIDGTIVTAHQKASGARGDSKIRPSAAPVAA